MARSRRWSARVMRMSNALDLERGVFTKRNPRAVALSLKRSAGRSKRRKSSPFPLRVASGAIPPGASQRASAPRLIFRLAA